MNRLTAFIGISLIWHLVLFLLIYNANFKFNHSTLTHLLKLTKTKMEHQYKPYPITISNKKELELIKKKMLPPVRTVGRDDGIKDVFTLPLHAHVKKKIKQNKQITSLSELATTENHHPVANIKKNWITQNKNDFPRISEHKTIKRDIFNEATNSNKVNLQQAPSNTLSFNTKMNKWELDDSPIPPLPENINLNLKLENAKGVSIDKLNPQELKFFSFNLRVFKSYIASIFQSYQEFKQQNPHKNFDHLNKQTLIATVIYNTTGQIDRISFVQSSEDDSIQGLFQRALEKNLVQNPPKEIVHDGQFELSYELVINP
ncbi:MAG: hypothetical protein HQK53_10760 [Oligoflexia bacterium]|nr:hypothetical protein [Oligoflexia bacterium]